MFHQSKKATAFAGRLIPTAAAVLLLVLLAFRPAEDAAEALYVVTNNAYVHVDELSGDVFLTDDSARLVSRENGNELILSAGQQAVITHQEKTLSTETKEETVAALLQRMHVKPSPLEMISVSFAEDTVHVEIRSEFVFFESISQVTEHEVIYQYCSYKPDWYENVIQPGSDGIYSEIYEVFYQDGEETSRQLIDIVDTDPVPAIVEVGTMSNFANNTDAVASIVTNEDGSGIITLENGQTVTFSGTRTMKGTAYNSDEPKVGTITATGTTVRVGVVAVDRKVLPLGTKVYVVSNDGLYQYGFAIAEDTGVRGNIIDLYMDTYEECVQFGVRDCTVYILD